MTRTTYLPAIVWPYFCYYLLFKAKPSASRNLSLLFSLHHNFMPPNPDSPSKSTVYILKKNWRKKKRQYASHERRPSTPECQYRPLAPCLCVKYTLIVLSIIMCAWKKSLDGNHSLPTQPRTRGKMFQYGGRPSGKGENNVLLVSYEMVFQSSGRRINREN